MEKNSITFRKAEKSDKNLLLSWFKKKHVQEFWDVSPEMWENVESNLNHSKILFDYWIGSYDGVPYSLVITSDAEEVDPRDHLPEEHLLAFVEDEGFTLTVDFMIGEEAFLEKGLGPATLQAFAKAQDPSISALLIDPEISNTKALHVYEKAGFVKVATFVRKKGISKGLEHYLLKLLLRK